MNEGFAVSFLLSLALVALVGAASFDRPRGIRSQTTAIRYRLGKLAHVAVHVVLMLLVYSVLSRLLASADHALLPILSASMTAAARALPMLADGLRQWLHRLCRIPNYARHFAKFLSITDFTPAAAVAAEARSILLHRYIDDRRAWLPLAQPAHRKLLQATALFIQLRSWEKSKRHQRFLEEARPEFDHLRQRFDGVALRTSRALTALERIGDLKRLYSERAAASAAAGPDAAEGAFDDHLRRLAEEQVADTCDDVSRFYREACTLAARGILSTEPTRARRHAAMRKLGFAPNRGGGSSVFWTLLRTGALLYVGIALFFLILPPEVNVLPMPLKVIVITLIVLGSFAVAIVPKRYWGFANAGLHPRAPMSFVVGAGLFAVLLGLCVNVAAGAILIGGWNGVLMRLEEARPYLHAPFFTAATVAWLVQDHRWAGTHSPAGRRLLDALVLGVAWVASAAIAEFIDNGGAPEIAPLVGALIFGLALGAAVPASVRADAVHQIAHPDSAPASEFGPPALPSTARWSEPRTEPAGSERAVA